MIKEFEINQAAVDRNWKTQEERDEIVDNYLVTLSEFVPLPVYCRGADMFAFCFKGCENASGNLQILFYGYALDCNSIKKFLEENYGEADPTEYLVTADLMSMDYDKYYKNGTFVGLDGKDTGTDFFYLDNHAELKKKAQFDNCWLKFVVYNPRKNFRGEAWKTKEIK